MPKIYHWDGKHAEEDFEFKHRLVMNGYAELQPISGHKYFINVGSVGQPRDNDPRACYAIFDSDINMVIMKRVPYDIAGAQNAIMEAGLPTYLAERLARGC